MKKEYLIIGLVLLILILIGAIVIVKNKKNGDWYEYKSYEPQETTLVVSSNSIDKLDESYVSTTEAEDNTIIDYMRKNDLDGGLTKVVVVELESRSYCEIPEFVTEYNLDHYFEATTNKGLYQFYFVKGKLNVVTPNIQ